MHEAAVANTHAGKEVAFSGLLKSVFKISGLEIIPNIENYIKSGEVRTLRGRMDLRLGKIIIEFKIDLDRELEKALEEIERYTNILRAQNEKVTLCIINDGLIFKVYAVSEKPKLVREIDFRKETPEQIILFLDTFLFSERKVPTADDLNMRFGPGSAIYEDIIGELSILFKGIKEPLKFNLWEKNMELVYGSTPPEESFVSQTYLNLLVRLILAKRLVKQSLSVRDAVTGKLFSTQGINIIEDDFFSWVLHPIFWHQVKTSLETIANALEIYDLEAVDEDIFKEIYQDIVKRGDRHKLGEYYTPEWLAELTLNEAIKSLDNYKDGQAYSILDPACGSGTFLTNAVKILRKQGLKLEQIIDNVYGLDLNPLAVMIARTNYLLAMGKLIESRKGAIFIPVFMSDSIRLPEIRRELSHNINILAIDAPQNNQLNLPVDIALNDSELKKVLTTFDGILVAYRAKQLSNNQALRAFENSYKNTKPVIEILKNTLLVLMKLIDANEDSVWVFMMRNVYAPLRMSMRKFSIIVGNPPWIAFRFIENPDYQSFVKSQVFNYGLLKPKQSSLFTQMDTSTVFYCKSADVYLADNGILGFVMPRSVLTGAKQHSDFKKQLKPKMGILKIIDTEEVNPLFNVDACSIIARKGLATSYPVESLILKGELPQKNLSLKNATRFIEKESKTYSPPETREITSPYYNKVFQGASIVPRTLWFVKFQQNSLGLDPTCPFVESLLLNDAKEPWKSISVQGQVESDFIFVTVTGRTLLPFKVNYLPVVLPLQRGSYKNRILNSEELRVAGKFNMANWVDTAEDYWVKNATKTSLKNLPSAMDRVNYQKLLTDQTQNFRYFVLYTASGSNLAAAVVDTKKIPRLKIGQVLIKPTGFVADTTTYRFGTNDMKEAYYLLAILNSNVVNERIKQHQPKGAFGPRHIHRRAFELNIPEYDGEQKLHRIIAFLGFKASREALSLDKASRTKIKCAIPSMKRIDCFVSKLLIED